MENQRQGLVLMTAICVFMGTLLILQLWLLAAALDAYRRHDFAPLLPAALASLTMFILNGGLLWYVFDFDRRIHRAQPHG